MSSFLFFDQTTSYNGTVFSQSRWVRQRVPLKEMPATPGRLTSTATRRGCRRKTGIRRTGKVRKGRFGFIWLCPDISSCDDPRSRRPLPLDTLTSQDAADYNVDAGTKLAVIFNNEVRCWHNRATRSTLCPDGEFLSTDLPPEPRPRETQRDAKRHRGHLIHVSRDRFRGSSLQEPYT
jgi:hypothetical protein